jgi:hypothetical protein
MGGEGSLPSGFLSSRYSAVSPIGVLFIFGTGALANSADLARHAAKDAISAHGHLDSSQSPGRAVARPE